MPSTRSGQQEHYFAERPAAKRKRFVIEDILGGRRLSFVSDASVFSKRKVDAGTKLLIRHMQLRPGDVALDLGCGYGPIGIAAAPFAKKVYMTDVNERAVELAEENARRNNVTNVEVRQGDGFEPVKGLTFDAILTNPPIRAGKKVVFRMIEDSKAHLRPGGSLWLVARTAQGAKSIRKKMEEAFGNAEYVAMKGGYRLMRSIRITRPS